MDNARQRPVAVPLAWTAAAFSLVAIVLEWRLSLEVIGPEWDLYPFYLRNSLGLARTFNETWPFSRGPGLLVATWIAQLVVSDPIAACRLVTIASGAALVFFGGSLAYRMTERRDVAIVAAVFLALSETVLRNAGAVGTDLPFAAAVTIGFALLFADRGRPGRRAVWLAGAALAFAYVTRYQAVVFVFFGFAAALWSGERIADRLVRAALFTAGVAVVIGAVAGFCAVTGLYPVEALDGRGLLVDTSFSEVRAAGGLAALWDSLHVANGVMQFVFSTGVVLWLIALVGPSAAKVRSDRRAQIALGACTLYFLAVVWHHAHAEAFWHPADSRRYFLPLLPFVGYAAAENLLRMRRGRSKRVAIGLVIAWLAVFAGMQTVDRLATPPNRALAFARAFCTEYAGELPLVRGYPPHLALALRRFGLVYSVYVDAGADLPDPLDPGILKYDYLVLPDDVADAIRRSDAGDWLSGRYESVFCASSTCAYREVPDSSSTGDGPGASSSD